MFWRGKRAKFERPAAPETMVVKAIGFVRNNVAKPRPRGWERVESEIELLPEQRARLAGIGAYSHVIVVFYMDLAADAPEQPETLTLGSGATYGVFATRSQLRPNHLGVSVVELALADREAIWVRGLDAIDGTPVLDIKPYLPEYDAVPGAKIPGG